MSVLAGGCDVTVDTSRAARAGGGTMSTGRHLVDVARTLNIIVHAAHLMQRYRMLYPQ